MGRDIASYFDGCQMKRAMSSPESLAHDRFSLFLALAIFGAGEVVLLTFSLAWQLVSLTCLFFIVVAGGALGPEWLYVRGIELH